MKFSSLIFSQILTNIVGFNRFNIIKFCITKWALVAILLFAIQPIFAQTEMHIFTLAPEWNGSEVCNPGGGYKPTPINAPSTSYSGKDIKEGLYDYVWEQKVDNETWVEISSEKSVKFIPACKINPLFNKNENGASKKFSWRLKVKDLANGNLSSESEIYSLTLASEMTLKFYSSASPNNKINISLSVVGGMGPMTYEWKATDAKIKVPATSTNQKDPEGLTPGEYQITVKDRCSSVSQIINTSNIENTSTN